MRTTVIDRGPFANGAKWDLTQAAAEAAALRGPPTTVRVAKLGQLAGAAQAAVGRHRAASDLVLRQRRGVGDQALELVQRQVGDRLEDLLVGPARLARLLGEVLRRPPVGRRASASRKASSAACFGSADSKLRARETSSRPSPAARAVLACWAIE